MSRSFADTSFFVAFLSQDDEHHTAASEYMDDPAARFVTTTWVLLELGNFLSAGSGRRVLLPFVQSLRGDARFEIIPAAERAFARGLSLYAERADKEWSLVDCTSFVIMNERRLTKALTNDHHFRQAGFRVLLT